MIPKFFKPFIWMSVFVLIVGAACNIGGSQPPATQAPAVTDAPVATQAPVETQAPVATEAPVETAPPTEESMAINNLQDVKKATIQIESQGTFIDPEFGLVLNGAGRGSGFIIDPEGIAVTNNHVVTGAALLRVWVGGESEPRNARVLGVSECSDLAVIDIDGDGYPYLDWYDGSIDVGMDMYVAGFPLGDPEYTLTKGVISKARANGETSWSSVDSVVEYDASSNPGNSGGPVVDPQGRVLAIHYAGNASTRQAFGISRDEASGIIDDLRSGENVDTIGVNGQAVGTEDGSITGVWVSSVQSGSAADQAGVQAGDIILMMENLVLATDGTMSQYCDILRSHQPGDTLSITVLRWVSGEYLEGQLNGRELAVTGTLDSGTSGDNTNTSSGDVPPGVVFNPNATEAGDVYYSTTFDSPLNDWIYFLTYGDEDNFGSEVADGRFRTQINARDTYVYYIYNDLIFTDVQIEVTAENFGANTNWSGIVCRYTDEGWYETTIGNTGEWQVFRYDSASGRYVLLDSGGSRQIRTGKEVNDFTVVCSGDQIIIGVNGTQIDTVSMKSAGYGVIREGQIGLTISATTVTPVIIEFDDFKAGIPY